MRSPLTETIFKVQGMIAYVRENLSTDEFMLFLDLLVPEPEPVVKAPTKKKRKSSGKSQCASNMAATLGKNRQPQKQRCVVCFEPRVHENHNVETGHEFQSSVSERAIQQLKHHEPKCAFEIDGKVCHGFADDSVHDKSLGYLNYHEFQPEQAQAAGGD